ncbi:MAG: hypothetical protein HKN82_10640 [Akkermansiaceae bacterium]|nr:hypothetical protein [Akkermansiaceae bacterium]NNM30153.1 hypothetical protein [Akkermansiaceae bacterium]
MKKLMALVLTLASGLYLVFGWVPDPIPFLDEGAALLVFLNCLAYLGMDLRRFFGMKPKDKSARSQTIDVD